MSLRHPWAFLAVALPVLAALIAPLPATDLTYHLRAGEEILTTGRHTGRRHVDVHDRRRAVARPAVGRAGHPPAVYRLGGWTGLVLFRAALVGLIAASIFELCRRQGTGVRLAAWLALARSRRGAGDGPAPAADRDGAVRAHAASRRRSRGASAPNVAGRPDRRRVGERPRQLLPGAGRARACLGRRRRGTALAGRPPGACRRDGDGRRLLPDAVRPGRLGLRGRARREPGRDGPDQRMAADCAGRHLRILFYGSALLVAAYLARRGRPTAWPTLLWLGFFFVIGAYAARGSRGGRSPPWPPSRR